MLLRLGAQGEGERGDGLGDVIAFFLPTGGHCLVARKFDWVGEGELQVVRGVVVVVEIGLGIGTPCVFDGEEQSTQELTVSRVAEGDFFVSQPLTAEAGEFTVLGYFGWVAGDAVYPGVADLLGDDGEVVADWVEGKSEVREA